MGLDMYLTGKRYLSKYSQGQDADVAAQIAQQFPELGTQFGAHNPVQQVSIRAAYWRKANAVHDWFVRNVQNGVDNCAIYGVSRADLMALRTECELVVDNPQRAAEVLPTTAGFFFGRTDYDEFYVQDLKNTIEQLNSVLSLPDSWDFDYQSCW